MKYFFVKNKLKNMSEQITFGDFIFEFEICSQEKTEYKYINTYLNNTIIKGNNKYIKGNKVEKISILQSIIFENNNEIEELKIEELKIKLSDDAYKYKIDENWIQAGNNYDKLANLTNNSNDYIDAGFCYKKINYMLAIDSFKKAIEIFEKEKNIQKIAMYSKIIAELYENNKKNNDALESYKKAVKYYNLNENNIDANICLRKVATFLIFNNNFEEASIIYKNIGIFCLEKKLTSFNTKIYFFQSLLCLLAIGNFELLDPIINDFLEKDILFDKSKEYIFIKKLIEICNLRDINNFNKTIDEYIIINSLEKEFIYVISEIKKLIL